MGGSHYSRSDYAVRSTMRANLASAKGISVNSATFAYDHDIKTGVVTAKVHPTLLPFKAVRESRDSATHPVTVPIAVIKDVTGSMAKVPAIIQKQLSHLMGCFLDDKASGKRYLGDGYPAILVGAVDDFNAMTSFGTAEGCLQIGQFESGIEIDDNLTNIWLTGMGGGTYEESYDLALYMMARHTAHDHWDKRGRKGHLFLIGDEHSYTVVSRKQVKEIIGDDIQGDIPLAEILAEVQERYHVFFIIPNMTNHYADPELEKYWVNLLGQQNVIKLDDPEKICECIAAAVAICEEHISVADLSADLKMGDALARALVPLSKGAINKYSAEGLGGVAGAAGATERL